jgi:DNA-binding CsgD family transcriptional regulator
MSISPSEIAVTQIRSYFTTSFGTSVPEDQVAAEVWKTLESPIFKQHIFAENLLVILDHATYRYRYVSPQYEEFFEVPIEEAMQKGPDVIIAKLLPADKAKAFEIFKALTECMMALPAHERLHFTLKYVYNIRLSSGIKSIHQHMIPLALNKEGFPYLMLAILSDISSFRKDHSIHYKLTLNVPGEPSRILLQNTGESRLTGREKEIVLHLAEGHDSQAIADKLFISEATVRTHRKNILEKTAAKNTVHLVRLAVANGWI